MENLSKSTNLKLLRNWDSPNFFFPMGMVSKLGYFSEILGMTPEEFIERFKESLFVGWFEISKD